MISESLLRLGYADVAADYLRWYAPHQFKSGKVPCCVDERGADPVPENDSSGEFIFLAGGNLSLHARSCAARSDVAARRRRDPVPRGAAAVRAHGGEPRAARRAFYGLLPASISHEGYSEKPMHSYWDDFWALKGYEDAVRSRPRWATPDAASRIAAQRDEFRRDLRASLQPPSRRTASTIFPDRPSSATSIRHRRPSPSRRAETCAPFLAAVVQATYERYWREFVDRRDGNTAWDDYTPYELRNVGTFVRLGWRDRAQELLAFFLDGRRPAAWNQWAEVVGRDPAKARFVGDMPHAWVASDFIRAVLDLFAYERDDDQSLVLAAGIPPAWLDGAGIAVRNLRTPYGPLSYSLRKEADARY